MKREDFKVVHKYYATSSLTMILHGDKIIASVEIYCNYQSIEDDKGKLKSTKDKRTPKAINDECENIIRKYIG